MKIILAVFALAIATPAAAEPAAQPADHSQHRQHGQADHSGHREQGQGQSGQPGQRPEGQGQRDNCPCCQPGADGQRPACCERMHQQQGQQSH